MTDVPPFAPQPGELELLKWIKQALDPQNVFNPGRLF
jgi:FAD/FMN-containing dehydrogenase